MPIKLKKLLPIGILLVVAAAGFLVWYFFIRQPPLPPEIVAVSGRIEGDDAAVAAKIPGRIREITVREGDQVKAGQVIATLDDEQSKAREEQAQSAVQQAEARVQRAQQQIAVLEAQLEQSRLSIGQARTDAEGRVSQAQAQLASAEASLAQAEANYKQARYDEERFAKLASQGDVPERTSVQARSNAEALAAVVRAANKQVDAARAAVTTARANLANVPIRAAQESAIRKQIAQAESDIKAAQSDAERARAQFREAQANRSDLTVVAPFDATVITRSAEPGEVVSAGSPIVTIVNLSKVYLRGFVPEAEIGRVKVGQSARVFLDSNPSQPIEAVVERIDPEASFTPQNIYFREDRVKQVFGVKLLITASTGAGKPGMPADGEILVQGNSWPKRTRR